MILNKKTSLANTYVYNFYFIDLFVLIEYNPILLQMQPQTQLLQQKKCQSNIQMIYIFKILTCNAHICMYVSKLKFKYMVFLNTNFIYIHIHLSSLPNCF